jgi:hypothetical protein
MMVSRHRVASTALLSISSRSGPSFLVLSCTRFSTKNVAALPQDVRVLRTNVPTVFTSTPIDPFVELAHWKGSARKIFGLPAKYCLPSEFNYAFPAQHVPEFAFVGRSNVGKSSLIAKLLGDDKLVRTSKLPGCTRSVNFFAFVKGTNSHVTYVVDLPGYGFAKAAKDEKAKWKQFIEGYLRDRTQSVLRYTKFIISVLLSLPSTNCSILRFHIF